MTHGRVMLDEIHRLLTAADLPSCGAPTSVLVDAVRCRLAVARTGAETTTRAAFAAFSPSSTFSEHAVTGGPEHGHHLYPISSGSDSVIAADSAGVHPAFIAAASCNASRRQLRKDYLASVAARKVVVPSVPSHQAATQQSALRERRRFCNIAAPLCDVVPASYGLERVAFQRLVAAAAASHDALRGRPTSADGGARRIAAPLISSTSTAPSTMRPCAYASAHNVYTHRP